MQGEEGMGSRTGCGLGALNPRGRPGWRLQLPSFEVTASFARQGVLQLQVSGASHCGTRTFS